MDRAEALALTEYMASLCPCGCGHLVAETTSRWEVGPEFDATHITCRARAAQIEAIDAAHERKTDTRAWLWTIQKLKG